MKITLRQLRDLIRESLSGLNEQGDSRDQNLVAIKKAHDDKNAAEFTRLVSRYRDDDRYRDNRVLRAMIQSGEEQDLLLRDPEPEEEITTVQGEEKVVRYPGDKNWEYKLEDDVWHARKRAGASGGAGKWIALKTDKYQTSAQKLDKVAAENQTGQTVWPKRSRRAIDKTNSIVLNRSKTKQV